VDGMRQQHGHDQARPALSEQLEDPGHTVVDLLARPCVVCSQL
jgi:hypothetical protein